MQESSLQPSASTGQDGKLLEIAIIEVEDKAMKLYAISKVNPDAWWGGRFEVSKEELEQYSLKKEQS